MTTTVSDLQIGGGNGYAGVQDFGAVGPGVYTAFIGDNEFGSSTGYVYASKGIYHASANFADILCCDYDGGVTGAYTNQYDGSLVLAGNAPEPSTWAMLMLGFAGLGYAGFRSSSRKAAAIA